MIFAPQFENHRITSMSYHLSFVSDCGYSISVTVFVPPTAPIHPIYTTQEIRSLYPGWRAASVVLHINQFVLICKVLKYNTAMMS